jgi:hypothetical protein
MDDREVAEVFTLRHLGKRQLYRLCANPRVLIETERGFWRAEAAGYTTKDQAAEYHGSEAYLSTKHCGPEKRVRYHLIRPPSGGAS